MDGFFRNFRALLCFIFFVACITTVTGLECYSCNSLGLGESHSNDACITLDKSQIGTEPCQVGAGQVGRCMVFKGTVTIDPPIFEKQTASGTYRSCAVFDESEVPANGCVEATNIPGDVLGTVFTLASLLGADQVIQGQSCYCTNNRCNVSNAGVRLDISGVNVLLLLVLALIQILIIRRM